MLTNIDPGPYTEKPARKVLEDFGVKYRITNQPTVSSTNGKPDQIPPFIKGSKFPKSDRDFSALKDKTKARLVLEFRVTGFSIIQNRGLAGTRMWSSRYWVSSMILQQVLKSGNPLVPQKLT